MPTVNPVAAPSLSTAAQIPDLPVDRLSDDGLCFEVLFKDDCGGPAGAPLRTPHRHAYHELVWNREGIGRQRIDGHPHMMEPNTVTIVGRGQMHTFDWGLGMSGAIVRFGDELLGDQAILQGLAGWLLDVASSRTIAVPQGEAAHLEDMLRTLEYELHAQVDRFSLELQSHLLSSLLLWLERWHEHSRRAPRADTRDVRVYHRFLRLLERDFPRHHEALHYAELLRLPAPALSRSLARVCGQSTKELILERVMLEAARLLRFSDVTVSEVAYAIGFTDPFYFSRAFKGRYQLAPLAYRARAGSALHLQGA